MIDVRSLLSDLEPMFKEVSEDISSRIINQAQIRMKNLLFSEIQEEWRSQYHNRKMSKYNSDDYNMYERKEDTAYELIENFTTYFQVEQIKNDNGNGSYTYQIKFTTMFDDELSNEIANEAMQRATKRFSYLDLSDYWSGINVNDYVG